MRHIFGPEGTEYLKSELRRFACVGGLGNRLASLPLEDGLIFSFLPIAPPPHLVASYGSEILRHSLLYHCKRDRAAIADMEYRVAELGFLSAWLKGKRDRLIMFHTPEFRFQSDWQMTRVAPGEKLIVWQCEDASFEGWTYIGDEDVNDPNIDLVRARGTSPYPPGIGVLTSRPAAVQGESTVQPLRYADTDQILAQIAYIAVEAFDNEALLFWQNQGPEPGPS